MSPREGTSAADDHFESTPRQAVMATDRRSARVLAAAQADRIRAHTEQVRTDTAERWKQEHETAREQRATARRAERARRSVRRQAAAGTVARAALRSAPSLAGAAACVAPTLIATRGQFEFGLEIMRLGAMAVLVPVMLEGAAWMLAWQRHQAIAAGDPSTRLTVGVWALAGTAAGLNFWHGSTGPGGSAQIGVTYGAASLVGFALVELLARHRAGVTARVQDRRGRRRLALARALRFPRVAWAAWSTRIANGYASDSEQAWRQAWSSTLADDRLADSAPSELPWRPTASTLTVITQACAPVDTFGDRPDPGADTASAPGHGNDQLLGTESPTLPETHQCPTGRGRLVGDDRVRDLADLLRAGAPVTGEQAGVIFGVSDRTGRRLVAEAKTHCAPAAEPPDLDPAVNDPAAEGDDPAGAAAERRLLHFPGSDSQRSGVSA